MLDLNSLVKGELTKETEPEFLRQILVAGKTMDLETETGFYVGVILALAVLKRHDLAYKLEQLVNPDQSPVTIN